MTRRASPGKVLGGAALVAMLSVAAATAPAQQDDEEDTEEQASIDEIVVIGNKDGDPVELEPSYEEQLRARIIAEYAREQALKDEARWRESLPTAVEDGDGRILWGYDARAESRIRRELDLTELPVDTRKPARILSIRF